MGGEFPWSQIIQWHIVSPIAYYIVFALPVLIATLLLDAWLKGLALTWYPLGGRVRRVFWSITAVLLVVQALVVIPIGNRLFFAWIYEIGTSRRLADDPGCRGCIIGVIAFAAAHRRLSNRCTECPKHIAEPSSLAGAVRTAMLNSTVGW